MHKRHVHTDVSIHLQDETQKSPDIFKNKLKKTLQQHLLMATSHLFAVCQYQKAPATLPANYRLEQGWEK